jgi:hypothetical protein
MELRPAELTALIDQIEQAARRLDGWIAEAEASKYEELASALRDSERSLLQATRRMAAAHHLIS